MRLFERFGKKSEKDTPGNKKLSDTRELELYSGMRVLVEGSEGNLLFIARLQDPRSHMAELFQYSEMEISQDMDPEALPKTAPVPVRIRGYNDNTRKAIFMEGAMSPTSQKHIWQIEDLNITAIENERSDPRLDMDLDAAVMSSN